MQNGRRQRRGRPQKPYVTSWGATIPGLYRKSDGRWRINATGKEFTEHDERLAVARFRQWLKSRGGDTICITATANDFEDYASFRAAWGGDVQLVPATKDRPEQLLLEIEEAVLWPWLKRQLHERAVEIAELVGIPQLARLSELSLPRDSIPLTKLWKEYETHKGSKASLRHVRRAWKEFCRVIKVSNVRDCTTRRLVDYADFIRSKYEDAEYARDIMKRVRRVVKFGKRRGLDGDEINAWLLRAEVFYVEPPEFRENEAVELDEAKPVKVDDLDALLRAADPVEMAAILCALNLCLHISEVLSIRWEELDLGTGVYMSARRKTGIRRVGVMWDVTRRALLRLPRTPGAVFKSSRGKAYHPNSFTKIFAALRVRAGVSPQVQNSGL